MSQTPKCITIAPILRLLELTNAEVIRSYALFPAAINNAHEAWGILSEEMDEFFAHVKTKEKDRNFPEMQKELIQIAAMALRTAIDLGGGL
jgi:hypothetical protein